MFKLFLVMILLLQIFLIGLSARQIASGIPPTWIGIHASYIAANVLFGIVNVCNLFR